jgi:hypothetical protein
MNTIQTDILVIGGGVAGTGAAIAAARRGAKVMLLESQFALGGIATNGMMCNMFGTHLAGEPFLGGIPNEITDILINSGHGQLFSKVPLSSGPNVVVDRVDYNPEYLKVLLEELTLSAGAQIRLGSKARSISRTREGYEVKLEGDDSVIHASYIVDATGNANCFKMAGHSVHRDEKKQPVTLMFRMCDVDKPAVLKLSSDEIQRVITEGMAQNILPARVLGIAKIPGSSQVGINATRSVNIDHNSPEALSRSMIEMRRQISEIVPFLKENLDGFSRASLSAVASVVGVRDADRIIGEYELTDEDLVAGTSFEDAVASCCYPVDIHVAEAGKSILKMIGGKGYYTIPYRSLISAGEPRMIAAGRCISSQRAAFASLRIIGTAMALGEAAGTAASLALSRGCDFRDLPAEQLGKTLEEQNLRIR